MNNITENRIFLKWYPRKKQSVINVAEPAEKYSHELVGNMLLSAISCLIQTASETTAQVKDYQLLEKALKGLDTQVQPSSKKIFRVIIKADFNKQVVNIGFPEKQGWVSMSETFDLACNALFDILHKFDNKKDIKQEIAEVLKSRFISTDLPPIEYTQEFIDY